MKKDYWPNEFKNLVTLGESTTAGGWSSCRQRCWAGELARLINEFQRVPVQLVNMGIGANLISTRSPQYEKSGKPAADERLDRHVLEHTSNGHLVVPDLLVISYGLNDARAATPLALFCEVMEDLIRRVRAKTQPLIVLLGPYFMSGFDMFGPDWNQATLETFHEYNDATRDVAQRNECLFVDLLAAYDNAPWLVHHDTVHANDLGHRVVANEIFRVLATHCSGLARNTQELEQHIAPWRDESVLQ